MHRLPLVCCFISGAAPGASPFSTHPDPFSTRPPSPVSSKPLSGVERAAASIPTPSSAPIRVPESEAKLRDPFAFFASPPDAEEQERVRALSAAAAVAKAEQARLEAERVEEAKKKKAEPKQRSPNVGRTSSSSSSSPMPSLRGDERTPQQQSAVPKQNINGAANLDKSEITPIISGSITDMSNRNSNSFDPFSGDIKAKQPTKPSNSRKADKSEITPIISGSITDMTNRNSNSFDPFSGETRGKQQPMKPTDVPRKAATDKGLTPIISGSRADNNERYSNSISPFTQNKSTKGPQTGIAPIISDNDSSSRYSNTFSPFTNNGNTPRHQHPAQQVARREDAPREKAEQERIEAERRSTAFTEKTERQNIEAERIAVEDPKAATSPIISGIDSSSRYSNTFSAFTNSNTSQQQHPAQQLARQEAALREKAEKERIEAERTALREKAKAERLEAERPSIAEEAASSLHPAQDEANDMMASTDATYTWQHIDFGWKVGTRHFAGNDVKSLVSPVAATAFDHNFFLRLHFNGPRVLAELRVGKLQLDLVLRNIEIYVQCVDAYGRRVVAHAAELEDGTCASDDPNSFGCCAFVFENSEGVLVEASRQMMLQQAETGGLRVNAFMEVGVC